MFKRFRFAKKLWKANKAATRVSSLLLASSLFPVAVPSGGIDFRLLSDTFALGYIYGVIVACGDQEWDQVEKGLFVQQVFAQLFPGYGQQATDFCNLHAAQDIPPFSEAMRIGFGEAIEMVASGGQQTMHALLDHIRRHYV